MKKIILTSCMSLLLFNCSSNSSESIDLCTPVKKNVATALADFTNTTADDYTVNCSKYKKELENEIKECGDENGEIQSLIDGLGDCSNSSNLSMSVGGVDISFDKVTTKVENGFIKVSGTLTKSSYTIYFEVPMNTKGKEVIEGFVAHILSADYMAYTSGDPNFNFTSNISVNGDNVLTGTFGGAVKSNGGGFVSLTGGKIDVRY
ncbi:hypothetical protein [Tenacibaculum ovolyticum]|uniref:hypothetical protein n=1 Tax=Tenacibaculum ovolyticum TaxID=104270 RepID=UPI0007EC8766|nr:hypothetical protein [Tenacibaculum ovolyticum]